MTRKQLTWKHLTWKQRWSIIWRLTVGTAIGMLLGLDGPVIRPADFDDEEDEE